MRKRPTCTGLAAGWCPIHGDCTCSLEQYLHDPSCALHSPDSTHAEPPEPPPSLLGVMEAPDAE